METLSSNETITIHVGKSGNLIGREFWTFLTDEHEIDELGNFQGDNVNQLEKLSNYFVESNNRFQARTVCIDINPNSLNALRRSSLKFIIRPENMIANYSGVLGNPTIFSIGRFTEGAEIMNDALNVIRKHAEAVYSLQNFLIFHSSCEGSGSGVTSLLLDKLSVEYPKLLTGTFSILPSMRNSEYVIEPYNAILSLPYLIDFARFTTVFDSYTVSKMPSFMHYTMGAKDSKISKTDIGTLKTNESVLMNSTRSTTHEKIAYVIAGLTASTRFPNIISTSLVKTCNNMAPIAKLHFFVPGYSPVVYNMSLLPKKRLYCTSLEEIIRDVFNRNNLLFNFRRNIVLRYLTISILFRGKISISDVENFLRPARERYASLFKPWLPNNIQYTVIDLPPKAHKKNASFLINTPDIGTSLRSILDKYRAMHAKRAYLHWYFEEGLEEADFREAEVAVEDLIDEYLRYGEALQESDSTVSQF